ncbi:DUF1259 domain-containing protein [Ectobacillus panaciterrae]|uniref:DUF1259 domain-containing protein n=1 Tax=Ectobacillus panaciterrae TaxID=363872 RepID=UPI000428B788|nr:DUF1259 domain-containing protein [Ectobacillus panaciterrae]
MFHKNKIIIGLFLVLVLIIIVNITLNNNLRINSNPKITTMANVSQQSNWQLIKEVIGKDGEIKTGNVYYISLPRTDLKVEINGIPLHSSFALGSWLAFKEINDGVMVMGDLVLTEEEVNLVMNELIKGGIEVTALHNHLLGESPNIMYMHIQGHGEIVNLAKTLRASLIKSNTPLKDSQAHSTGEFKLEKEQIDNIFGKKGTISNGIYKISFPRVENIIDKGMIIPPSMGIATAINFQPTDKGKAAITGDFVLTAKEVNSVIRTLRKHNIQVTALHNHMLYEKPRLFFLHFWANDNVIKLAKGLREAIENTNSIKGEEQKNADLPR